MGTAVKALRDWNLTDATDYLKSIGLSDKKVCDLNKAGEGNMNCTLRAVLDDGSTFILKQSSAFCEKYPQVAAPVDRIREEVRFYELGKRNEKLKKAFPKILNFNEKINLLVMEDLGTGSDFSFCYETGKEIAKDDLKTFAEILKSIHSTEIKDEDFFNRPMRLLNHEHIFDIPLRKNNGLNLDQITPGLEKLAKSLISDEVFKRRVAELGGLYLVSGENLVHGDYYPMSWLQTERGSFVIDPEFGFKGLKEFDLGVVLAHLQLSAHSENAIEFFLGSYGQSIDFSLAKQFAAVEVIRRLIGVAQLPLAMDLNQKEALLTASKQTLNTH